MLPLQTSVTLCKVFKATVTISGADKLIKRLGTIDKQMEIDIKDIVEEVTLLIERQAISNAPVAGDRLSTTYGSQKNETNISQLIEHRYLNNGFIGMVYVSNRLGELPVYVEFGTGVSAAGYVPTLPKWAQEVARRYYINGKGTLIKQPYLLPAYFQHSPELYRRLKTMIKAKKI